MPHKCILYLLKEQINKNSKQHKWPILKKLISKLWYIHISQSQIYMSRVLKYMKKDLCYNTVMWYKKAMAWSFCNIQKYQITMVCTWNKDSVVGQIYFHLKKKKLRKGNSVSPLHPQPGKLEQNFPFLRLHQI